MPNLPAHADSSPLDSAGPNSRAAEAHGQHTASQRAAGPTPRILLTGATGFLGQAILQSLLETIPGASVTALVRPKGTLSGRARLERLLRKPVFSSWAKRSSADAVKAAFDDRVTVIDGDLGSVPAIDFPVDVVIHSASTVSFDPPIDDAFRTNVGGAQNLYQALLDSGQDPHVIHVSTAYVGGVSKGLHREGSLRHDVDWRAEYRAALAARDRVEAESRSPEELRKTMRGARGRRGRMGPKAVAAEAESARRARITARLSDFGRARAESVGWTDVYTFTKAMAERVGEELWAGNGHRLSVVRPSIIESAMVHPFPGWIDGYKVADPLIMAYGRGMLPEFPGLADSVLDIIPVDYVVNVIVALATQDCCADRLAIGRRAVDRRADGQPATASPADSAIATPEHRNADRPRSADYYHVVSGTTKPLPFHKMVSTLRDFFTEHPIPGEDGKPLSVPAWNFPNADLIEKRFAFKEISTQLGRKLVTRLPAGRHTRAWAANLRRTSSELDTVRQFSDLYRQYTKTEMVFDDEHTRALRSRLTPEFLDEHDFDVAQIDWRGYFHDVHLPALTKLTHVYDRRPATPKSKPTNDLDLPDIKPAENALAVFDLDGTVVSSNIVQQYMAAVRATRSPTEWPGAMANLLASIPGFLIAESRDRSELIRMVDRKFKGTNAARLRELVASTAGNRIRASIRPGALELIARHKEAGHRTVLVTGALDVLVEPLKDLFDDMLATRMDVDEGGHLTGYLATPPLVDEARANWLRKYAEQRGADLRASYGYGDSLADAVWLDLVGKPVAVCPDQGLFEIASRKRWKVLEW